ncbi:MAG: IS66 family insertion sequence element accessory protein TnpB [Candidatus Eisenbacteria sp.]|nr:IS66 family insertion sequence element accessory protein TnpB [Candidatus Eisenbacteria bacterium]
MKMRSPQMQWERISWSRLTPTMLRLLVYDGQVFWLCYRRLSRGRFRWWPSCVGCVSGSPCWSPL